MPYSHRPGDYGHRESRIHSRHYNYSAPFSPFSPSSPSSPSSPLTPPPSPRVSATHMPGFDVAPGHSHKFHQPRPLHTQQTVPSDRYDTTTSCSPDLSSGSGESSTGILSSAGWDEPYLSNRSRTDSSLTDNGVDNGVYNGLKHGEITDHSKRCSVKNIGGNANCIIFEASDPRAIELYNDLQRNRYFQDLCKLLGMLLLLVLLIFTCGIALVCGLKYLLHQ